tara:strand:+ start:262 stop:978 length:717 start_codon:yes stop_codon:yes gene_type:complete
MANLANNHLSNAAKLGRFGDDSMRFVNGEMSHVNRGEAKLIDVLGMQGEDMVQESGSGTINPSTGMREYAGFDPFSMIGVGLAIGSAFKENRIQRDQWQSGIDAAEQGLRDIGDQENLLDKVKDSRTNIAGMEYQKELKDLSLQTGFSIDDLNKKTEESVKQSNMAFSGTIETKQSDMWNRIQTTHGSAQEGLMAKLGKKMGEITSSYESEKSRLKGEKKKLSREIDLYDSQLGGWFG